MSAVLSALRRDPVARLAGALEKATADVVDLERQHAGIEADLAGADDPVAAVRSLSAVRASLATAHEEREALTAALSAARRTCDEAAREAEAREEEKRQAALQKEAERLGVEIEKVLEDLCRLAGRNEGVVAGITGPTSRFSIEEHADAASARACAGAKPKTVKVDHGNYGGFQTTPFEMAVSVATQTLNIILTVPVG
jgi:hypothetical protein